MEHVTGEVIMEPTKDDLADTLTATLRELRNLHQKLDTIVGLATFALIGFLIARVVMYVK